METQLTDITPQSTPPTTSSPPPSSPQSPHAPNNFTDDRDDTLLPVTRKIRKFFLGIPIISLVVGGVLLIAEVAIIILMLAAPRTVGISEDAALTRAQRGVLGAVSVLMLVEAVLLGIIDIGTERQRARLVKAQRQLAVQHLDKLKSLTHDTGEGVDTPTSPLSMQQVGQLLVDQIAVADRGRRRLTRTQLAESVHQTAEEVQELQLELNHHTIQYMAALVFDLASFMWKWTLALLVISNNWVSVGVAIVGGVVYPLVVFWQKAINPSP